MSTLQHTRVSLRVRRIAVSQRSWWEAHASDALLATLAIALVAWPLLTRSRESLDFSNYLWLAWVAGKETVTAGHPVFFTNTGADGPFYPVFAFYGGTLFVATGLLGALLGGHILTAYIAVWVLAIAGAYLGTLSLARQLGVRGVIAHGPALCVITSAYYITNIYARGDWPELVAASAVPPLAASALHLIRAERWRLFPVFVFALSAVILTGSHNLTLIWAVTLGLVGLLILWLASGRTPALPYRRLGAVVGLGVAAACVNGWFLLTDLFHGQDVGLGNYTTTQGGVNAIFDSLGVLLNPFRDAPHSLVAGNPKGFRYLTSFYVNAPVWFLAWGVVAGAFLLWRRSGSASLRRIWVATLVLVALLIFVIADPWWSNVPFPWDETQFPYRLDTYLAFAIAGVVLVAALLLQRADRARLGRRATAALGGSLIVAVAVSVGLCVWQEAAPKTNFFYYSQPSHELVSIHKTPRSWYASESDYADTSAPIAQLIASGRIMAIPWTKVHGDSFSGFVDTPPGPTPIETNIVGGDYVVRIGGVKLLGRASTGQAVVERLGTGSKPVHVVIRTADTRAVSLGRILSIAGLLVLLLVFAFTATRGHLGGVRRLRRSRLS